MGGPPATLISATWPSGTNDCRPAPPAANGAPPRIGDGCISEPAAGMPPPCSIRPAEGMSDIGPTPEGRRGRGAPVPPDGSPPPIPSMFWARKIGCGQPSMSGDPKGAEGSEAHVLIAAVGLQQPFALAPRSGERVRVRGPRSVAAPLPSPGALRAATSPRVRGARHGAEPGLVLTT